MFETAEGPMAPSSGVWAMALAVTPARAPTMRATRAVDRTWRMRVLRLFPHCVVVERCGMDRTDATAGRDDEACGSGCKMGEGK
jgi:hypothetical protein